MYDIKHDLFENELFCALPAFFAFQNASVAYYF